MSCCRDVMTPGEAPSCCMPHDTATQAAQAMRDSGCGCAPVVEDTEHLKLIGVVTERDVCCGVAADDRRASDVRVETIMQTPVCLLWCKRAGGRSAPETPRASRDELARFEQGGRLLWHSEYAPSGEIVEHRTTASINSTSHSTS